MNVIKELLASLTYIIPTQNRINRVILETSSRNLINLFDNKNIDKCTESNEIVTLYVDYISEELINSKNYKNIKFISDFIYKNFTVDQFSVYLTGSYGSEDFVKNWSDIDIVVIINKDDKSEIELIFKKLYKINKYLYKDDLFQHHGFLILHKSDLFDETRYFPFEILDKGFCLFGNKDLKFYKTLNQPSFKYMKSFFDSNKFEEIDDFFTFKNYIHQITLFPSLYYQFRGEVLYKKEAIEKFINEFYQLNELYNAASEIRFEWPTFKLLDMFSSNNIIFLRAFRILFSKLYKVELNRLKNKFSELEKAPKILKVIDEK